MGNTLKVALVQEIGDGSTQRTAFRAMNKELGADALRVVHVLGNMFVGKPVELADEGVAAVVDTVLAETNNGSQLGFGTPAEAQRTSPTLGVGEWVWGEVFADSRHREARHTYAQRAAELRQATQAALETGGEELAPHDRLVMLTETAQAAKRRSALAALCVVAELNAADQAMNGGAEVIALAVGQEARPETSSLAAAV